MQRGCSEDAARPPRESPRGPIPHPFFGANNPDPFGIPTDEEAGSLHNPYQRPIAIHLASSCCPCSRSYKHPSGSSTCRSLLDPTSIPITSLRRPGSPMHILAASLRHPCCADGTPCHLWSLDTPALCNSGQCTCLPRHGMRTHRTRPSCPLDHTARARARNDQFSSADASPSPSCRRDSSFSRWLTFSNCTFVTTM